MLLVENPYEDTRLEIEDSWWTRSYLPDQCYEADQAMGFFDNQTR